MWRSQSRVHTTQVKYIVILEPVEFCILDSNYKSTDSIKDSRNGSFSEIDDNSLSNIPESDIKVDINEYTKKCLTTPIFVQQEKPPHSTRTEFAEYNNEKAAYIWQAGSSAQLTVTMYMKNKIFLKKELAIKIRTLDGKNEKTIVKTRIDQAEYCHNMEEIHSQTLTMEYSWQKCRQYQLPWNTNDIEKSISRYVPDETYIDQEDAYGREISYNGQVLYNKNKVMQNILSLKTSQSNGDEYHQEVTPTENTNIVKQNILGDENATTEEKVQKSRYQQQTNSHGSTIGTTTDTNDDNETISQIEDLPRDETSKSNKKSVSYRDMDYRENQDNRSTSTCVQYSISYNGENKLLNKNKLNTHSIDGEIEIENQSIINSDIPPGFQPNDSQSFEVGAGLNSTIRLTKKKQFKALGSTYIGSTNNKNISSTQTNITGNDCTSSKHVSQSRNTKPSSTPQYYDDEFPEPDPSIITRKKSLLPFFNLKGPKSNNTNISLTPSYGGISTKKVDTTNNKDIQSLVINSNKNININNRGITPLSSNYEAEISKSRTFENSKTVQYISENVHQEPSKFGQNAVDDMKQQQEEYNTFKAASLDRERQQCNLQKNERKESLRIQEEYKKEKTASIRKYHDTQQNQSIYIKKQVNDNIQQKKTLQDTFLVLKNMKTILEKRKDITDIIEQENRSNSSIDNISRENDKESSITTNGLNTSTSTVTPSNTKVINDSFHSLTGSPKSFVTATGGGQQSINDDYNTTSYINNENYLNDKDIIIDGLSKEMQDTYQYMQAKKQQTRQIQQDDIQKFQNDISSGINDDIPLLLNTALSDKRPEQELLQSVKEEQQLQQTLYSLNGLLKDKYLVEDNTAINKSIKQKRADSVNNDDSNSTNSSNSTKSVNQTQFVHSNTLGYFGGSKFTSTNSILSDLEVNE